MREIGSRDPVVAQHVSLLGQHYWHRKSATRKRSLKVGHPFDNPQITRYPSTIFFMEELPTIGPERPLADANAFLGTNPTGRTDKFPLARRPRIIPYCSVSDPLRSPFCQGRPHLSAQRLIVGLKAKTPRKAELLRRWMLIRSDQFEPDCR